MSYIELHDWNGLITLALFFCLFGAGIGAICYIVGKSHGHIVGRLEGLQEARGIYIPKIMQATMKGAIAQRRAQAKQLTK